MTTATQTDWNPEAYSRFRGLRLRPALDLLMQTGTPPAGDIIDLGCGDGTTAIPAAQKGADVLGVDIASNLVAAGNARAVAEKMPQVIGRLLPVLRLLGPGQRAQLIQFLQLFLQAAGGLLRLV